MKKLKLFLIACFLLTSPAAFAQGGDMGDWSIYGDSLKNCTAGTFNLSDFAGTPIKFEIVGMNAGNCQVNITKNVTLPGQQTPSSVILNCSFPKASLAILTKAAKDLSSGNATVSSDDPASKIMASSCKQTNKMT